MPDQPGPPHTHDWRMLYIVNLPSRASVVVWYCTACRRVEEFDQDTVISLDDL